MNRLRLPIRQAQIADMLGLSLVHTNRTIKALDRDGLVFWQPGEIHVPDLEAASDFANFERREASRKPFI
jgi:CRP-like cAMP-binding protein